MAELTKLTGTYIRSGSIPTTALSGGVVSSSLQIISALPTGSVSSSAQVVELLPVGTVSSSTQVDYTVLSNVPAGIASSSAQVTAYLPTDTVSSSGQVTAFLPTNSVSSSGQVTAFLPTNTVSSSGQVTAFLPTGTVSQSSQVDITGTTNYTSFSSSIATVDTAQTNRLTTLESVTGSYATTGSNTFVAPQTISDTTNSTSYLDGALHVAGGMSVRQDVRISGSMTINGLLTAVSMSTQYVTSSQYNVGTSRITLNDDDNVRFAGLSIIDSGSASPASASIFWDSLQHRFIYENLSGSSYNSSIIIAGPKHTGSLGDEPTLTSGYLPYATGTDHIDNSVMFQSSSRIGIGTTNPTVNLDIENGSGWAGLDLNGTSGGEIRLQKNGTTYGQLYASEGGSTGFVINAAGAGNDIYFQNAGTTTMTILDSGNVGIGTASPLRKLHVAGDFILTDNAKGLLGLSTGAAQRILAQIDSSDNYQYANGSVSVLSSGNVGIGTTNPTQKLSINGSGGTLAGVAAISLYDTNSNSSRRWAISNGAGGNATDLIGKLVFSVGSGTSSADAISGSAAMVIDSSGNFGLGTTNPAAYGALTVFSSGIGGFFNSTSGAAGINFYENGSGRFSLRTLNAVAGGLIFYDSYNGAERARIDNSGNLGIGTTSPQTALHLIGNMTVGNSTYSRPALTATNWGYSTSYRVLMVGSTSTSYSTQNTGAVTVAFNYDPSGNANGSFNGDGREIIFRRGTQFVTPNAADTSFNLYNLVLLDGNVGINTATPGYSLHVNGTINITQGSPIRSSGNWLLGQDLTTNYIHMGSLSITNDIGFDSNGATRLFITGSTGNVGIGTTNPKTTLDVYTNSDIWHTMIGGGTSKLLIGGQATGGIVLQGGAAATANNVAVTSAYNLILQRDGGNVGIGTTSPSVKLNVAHPNHGVGIDALSSYASSIGGIFSSAASSTYPFNTYGNIIIGTRFDYGGFYDIVFTTAASNNTPVERMVIKSSGNVGIGTTSPGSKLDVRGATRLYAGGSGWTDHLNLYSSDNTNIWNVLVDSGASNKFRVAYNSSQKFEVDTSGNVGLGAGSSASYRLYISGDQYINGTLTEASSMALKENIHPITDALSIIKNITGYTYDRKDGTATNQSGFIAEEVAEVLPGVVSVDEQGNPTGVQYTKIIAYLVESIKELKAELDELKRQ